MTPNIRATLAIVAALGTAQAIAPAAGQTPDTVEAHLAAAKAAAAFDFTGTLARLCVARRPSPAATWRRRRRRRGRWYTEPGKVFDNLYFVGSRIHSAWALTSSEGIILIDTLFDYNSEEAIVGGLTKLGLDPATSNTSSSAMRIAITSAARKLMQDRFNSRIVMGAPDREGSIRP